MKIGLNGQKILDKNPAGPEIFTINLFENLAKIDLKNEYFIYTTRKPEKDLENKIKQGNEKFHFKEIEYRKLWTQYGLAKELIKNPVDVFFTAIHSIPMIRSSKTKFVVMIHGLEYQYTSGYKNPLNKFFIERPIRYAIKHSDKIITPSLATKKEILKRNWNVDEKKIEVVYEGVSEEFYPKSEEEIDKIRKKYEIGKNPYLLFVSTIQPRKNIPNMIRAFSQFISENKDMKNTLLLIIGKKGWDYEESLEAPQKYGVEKNVKFLGRIPEEDLPILYSGAKGYINVSFEEGFGLPLLESMACGIPSVVSNIPAHKEVGDYLPIYVDPNNIENIKDGIFEIMTRSFDKKEFIERSKNFSWKNTAEKTLEVLEKTLKEN
ncbi:MAG TPA: glycosyltransferase family 1 protein [bacterium]|nr:glycosyltransferase family 1 protein [bacterium]HQG79014.1 glycosyltransferase family 1 protein [bacterium]